MSSSQRQQVSAIIYDKRGRVLSVGQNSYVKTHPFQAKHAKLAGMDEKVYLHAEIHAIVRCKDISKANKILVTRWGKKGSQLYAKPCPVCMSAIEAAGIDIIEYSK